MDHALFRFGLETKMDREANTMASEILMPDKLVAKAGEFTPTMTIMTFNIGLGSFAYRNRQCLSAWVFLTEQT